MMIKPMSLSIAFLWIMHNSLFAQVPSDASPNMIPNPSFEEVTGNPTGIDINSDTEFEENLVAWKSASEATPDLEILLPTELEAANKDGTVIDMPHTGDKMGAIYTYYSRYSRTYCEYMEVKLDRPIRKGREYYIEFWVCRSNRSGRASNNLGVMLSPNFTYITGNGTIDVGNHVLGYNMAELLNPGKPEWVRLSGTFVAEEECDYLIIGNFFGPDNTKIVTATEGSNGLNIALYLIDDVALHELNYTEENSLVEDVPMEVGTKIDLDKVFFETAKWGLLPESFEQLDKVIELMKEYPNMEIEIHGHTDNRGSESENQELSENRTRSVYEYLVSQGVAEDRMVYVGYGEMNPIANNETSEGRQLNRRVEFVITAIETDSRK